jgi:hypothetical protein
LRICHPAHRCSNAPHDSPSFPPIRRRNSRGFHSPSFGVDFADQKKRVGLIGTGWYGKCDLFRLIQVAPVEVVSLCDVDAKMLSEAADMVAGRQLSKKKPRTYGDYRKMLAEKDLDWC